jgi:predicted Zn-dependent protease
MQMIDDFAERFRTATSLRDRGDFTQARAILELLAKERATEFLVWLVLGGVQMSQEDYEGAEHVFSVAVALKPRSELASLSMFHTLKHLGRMNDAFSEMRRFLTLRPESHEYDMLRQEMSEGDHGGVC